MRISLDNVVMSSMSSSRDRTLLRLTLLAVSVIDASCSSKFRRDRSLHRSTLKGTSRSSIRKRTVSRIDQVPRNGPSDGNANFDVGVFGMFECCFHGDLSIYLS